ncbi:putative ribonuclease H-like domain-containing protein [Tanacetum coccineum]
MDVKCAFLYGTIEDKVYVCQPPGFLDPEFPNKVYKVEKALYGLHQAPRAWYDTLSTYLIENRFRRGIINKTLFIKKFKNNILLVQVYVDDFILDQQKKGQQVEQRVDASTPMETQKPLTKDENGSDVDVHLYRFHFIRDCYEKRLIQMVKIHTDFNVADLLTKAFDVTRFKFLIASIGMLNPYINTLEKHRFEDEWKLGCEVLNFCPTYKLNLRNMVAFLKKPIESEGFTEVVDFLKVTFANGTQQIQASIDNKPYTITKASVRSKLHLADAAGINNLPDADIYAGLATLGKFYTIDEATSTGVEVDTEGATTTTSGLDAGLDSGIDGACTPNVESKLEAGEGLKDTNRLWEKHSHTNEETEAQGRKIKELDDDPLVLWLLYKSLSQLIREEDTREEKSPRERKLILVWILKILALKILVLASQMIKKLILAAYKFVMQIESLSPMSWRSLQRHEFKKLYKIFMKKYGMIGPEDEYEKVLWEYMKNMFDAPLKSTDIYMLIERNYPLSAEVCKAILDKKLQGGIKNGDCYKLLKLMEKQADCTKALATPEQTATGKEISNSLTTDSLLKTIRSSMYLVIAIKH